MFSYFEKVDMTRQALVLTMALTTIVHHYANPNVAIDHYLRHLGTMHSRWKIPPELYPKWCDTMLKVLARSLGEDWDEELAGEWRKALEKASQTLIRGYDRPVGV
jgi:hemoglobin-like flavoprotein